MKTHSKIFLISFSLIINSCITQFIPVTNEDKNLLIVEGLITDQAENYSIKLSTSMSLGTRSQTKTVSGCTVTVSDNSGNNYNFYESSPGTYLSDPSVFQGIVGEFYTLHINTNSSGNNHIYESGSVELKPVPPIDSLYYKKVTIVEEAVNQQFQQGAQVYLDTHDPSNTCKFYRWEFSETWEFNNPYLLTNNIGWVSDNSHSINIKNTSGYGEDLIKSYLVNFISNQSDRLSVRYSTLISQYSLNEDEFHYWEKLQNVSENNGGLYDIVPSFIPSNISCIDEPANMVLGYFSVSAKKTKRLFIKDHFYGLVNLYSTDMCVGDTIYNNAEIPNVGVDVWILVDHRMPPPSYKVITYNKGCADVTVRGTNIEPDFWNDDKK